MSELIKQKRESLETFIREQMIGPNGCLGKFSLVSDETEDDCGELINTTPGSIYSTAVLFPNKCSEDSGQCDEAAQCVQKVSDIKESGVDGLHDVENDNLDFDEDDEDLTTTDNNEQNGAIGNDSDDEDVRSLSRRFPNMIGLSCCFAPDVDLNHDIIITFSGRYYTKIVGNQIQRVQVLVKDNLDEFEHFFTDTPMLNRYFSYEAGKISIKRMSTQDVGSARDMLRGINKDCAKTIAKNTDTTSDEIFLEIAEANRFLLSYREKLFGKLNRVKREKDEDGNETTVYLSPNEVNEIKDRIAKIELYETFLSYFDDLLELYDHKGFGFWQSHDFVHTLDLSHIDFRDHAHEKKQTYSPQKYEDLNKFFKKNIAGETFLALSSWLQVTKNSKDNADKNIYFKVLLVNDSTPFHETHKNYFSIVNEGVNELCFFGIKIEIESKKIIPFQVDRNYSDDKDDQHRLNYLYRNICDYGIGHFCSVDWPKSGDVNRIWSEFIPTYETPDIEPEPRNKYANYTENSKGNLVPSPYLKDTSCLQFKWLSTFSDTSDERIVEELRAFLSLYREWISTAEGRTKNSDGESFASRNLKDCRADLERMQANVEKILGSNKENMHCFRLMNSAMFMQLWHNKKENQEKIGEDTNINESFYCEANDELFVKGQHAAWRPFQLAFILLNLDGIIKLSSDEKWPRRNDWVDLVWFPTGGGKTEAYLGIIALCIIYRRRQFGNNGAGVAAIMRYTLRLLTTQQFQRALRLILALEQMRLWKVKLHDERYNIGDSEISIGLYVGSKSLPNNLTGDDSLDDEALRWNNREDGQNKTRIPLDRCPWCGSRLTYSTRGKRFQCSNENACTFEDGLPVRLCDEQIYKDPPTLLLGTVDKFASLAHKVSTESKEVNKDSRRLFGKGIDCMPPDLIIQDELHLLLGPLGSAVGLFECAIDQLCTREDGTRPKIISSTATTRNTELQIRALYDRNVNIFPHNGTDYDDSFFAFYERKQENNVINFVSKRKYMGIMPTGRTQMTTQMRLAAILLVHRAMFEKEYFDENGFEYAADNYYSIISYFNSLKEVGKTDAQFYTEYVKYVRRLFKRVMRPGKLLECFYTMSELKESELSGRLSGEDVNEKFAEVGQNWSIENRLPHKVTLKGREVWTASALPPDYILATNMISVGLDVSRFNTIIINSMPRNIAEYIQATSRVARKEKGLVITLHNPFRSRDVSHFEQFRGFHEKLYYYVEPISITPFSEKSVDKYFPLYLAAIIRHSFAELANQKAAIRMNDDFKSSIVKKVTEYFENRYNRTKNLEGIERELLTKELTDYIISFTEKALAQWESLAKENSELVYKQIPNGKEPFLFTSPSDYEDGKNESLWTVPQSLRIVEPEAVLHIKI